MEPFSFTARDGLTSTATSRSRRASSRDEPARGAQRARRAVGPRRLGVQPGGAVARQPRLPVRPGELPGLDRLRQGVRQRRRPRVGRQDARRPASTRSRWAVDAGLGRPGQGRDLRRLLRRLRGARRARRSRPTCSAARSTSSARRTSRRCSRSIPPYWAPMIAQLHRRVGNPETDAEFLLVAVAAVPGARHQDPAADRAGGQRPAGQAGRVRADRRRADRGGHRPRVHALPRRGPRLRQAREPDQVLHRGRAVPRQVPRRALRGIASPGSSRDRMGRRCRQIHRRPSHIGCAG